MLPKTPTRGTILPCDGLTLPVNQLAVDGIVPIPCGRRKLPFGLVQRKGKEVGAELIVVEQSFAPRPDLHAVSVQCRSEHLEARVTRMHGKRNLRKLRE